jgi:hypothetical protein
MTVVRTSITRENKYYSRGGHAIEDIAHGDFSGFLDAPARTKLWLTNERVFSYLRRSIKILAP